jgi:hypothetical protein
LKLLKNVLTYSLSFFFFFQISNEDVRFEFEMMGLIDAQFNAAAAVVADDIIAEDVPMLPELADVDLEFFDEAGFDFEDSVTDSDFGSEFDSADR